MQCNLISKPVYVTLKFTSYLIKICKLISFCCIAIEPGFMSFPFIWQTKLTNGQNSNNPVINYYNDPRKLFERLVQTEWYITGPISSLSIISWQIFTCSAHEEFMNEIWYSLCSTNYRVLEIDWTLKVLEHMLGPNGLVCKNALRNALSFSVSIWHNLPIVGLFLSRKTGHPASFWTFFCQIQSPP